MTTTSRDKDPRPDSACAARIFPSPNHGPRKNSDGSEGRRSDTLILHYTGMNDAGEALQRLCNPVAEVSCHYFVFENGHILQLVPEARRAWHAGRGFWAGEEDLNSCSIGIEIAHPGHDGLVDGRFAPWPEVQISATLQLCRDICQRLSIRPERVLAHSDIAPERKQDPGETFDWRRFAEAGVGLWVEPAPIRSGRFFTLGDQGPPVEAVQAMFAIFGYGIAVDGLYDERMAAVVRAFQRHWRQEKVDGVADASTITTLRDLIRQSEAPMVA